MHLAPIGDAVRICWVYNFQNLVMFFFAFRCPSPTNAGWFGASIGSAPNKKKIMYLLLPHYAIHEGIAYQFRFTLQKWKYTEIKENKETSVCMVRDL